jgi:outer membrane biosynthesis protein TonB
MDLPAGTTLFDRARAVAVQARLMITWPTDEPPPPPPRKLAPPPPPEPPPEPVVAAPPEPAPEPPPPEPIVIAVPLPRPVIVRRPEPAFPLVPVILAGTTAAAAGTFAALAGSRYNSLSDHTQPLVAAQDARDQGKTFQTTSLVLGGIALTSAAVAVVMYLTQERP